MSIIVSQLKIARTDDAQMLTQRHPISGTSEITWTSSKIPILLIDTSVRQRL